MKREPILGPNAGPFFLVVVAGILTYLLVRFVIMPPINGWLFG